MNHFCLLGLSYQLAKFDVMFTPPLTHLQLITDYSSRSVYFDNFVIFLVMLVKLYEINSTLQMLICINEKREG